jgi:TonB family protein
MSLLARVLLLLAVTCAASSANSSDPSTPPDSTKLIPVKTVKAIYPIAAAKNMSQGQVLVKLHINELGDVESAEVVSGPKEFQQAALSAAKKWKFEAFIRGGKPVKVNTTIPFSFAFSENVKDQVETTARTASSGTSADPNSPVPDRLPSGVAAGHLIHKVTPTYPPAAKSAHVQGVVLLDATIGKDGSIQDLRVISGDSLLVDAAIGAVQQWRYSPFLLAGEPVAVRTTITVNFSMR